MNVHIKMSYSVLLSIFLKDLMETTKQFKRGLKTGN